MAQAHQSASYPSPRGYPLIPAAPHPIPKLLFLLILWCRAIPLLLDLPLKSPSGPSLYIKGLWVLIPPFFFYESPLSSKALELPQVLLQSVFPLVRELLQILPKGETHCLPFILESLGFLPQLPPLVQCLFGFRGWTSRLLTAAFSHSYLVPSTAILGKRDHSLTPHPSEMVPCEQGSLSVVLTQVSQEPKTVPSTW